MCSTLEMNYFNYGSIACPEGVDPTDELSHELEGENGNENYGEEDAGEIEGNCRDDAVVVPRNVGEDGEEERTGPTETGDGIYSAGRSIDRRLRWYKTLSYVEKEL